MKFRRWHAPEGTWVGGRPEEDAFSAPSPLGTPGSDPPPNGYAAPRGVLAGDISAMGGFPNGQGGLATGSDLHLAGAARAG